MQTVDNCALSRPDAIFPRLNFTNAATPKVVWVLLRAYSGDGFIEPEAVFAWDFQPKAVEDFNQSGIDREDIHPMLIKELIEDHCALDGDIVYCLNRVTLSEKM